VRYTPGWIEELTTRASGWATLGLRSDAGGEQSSMSAESAYCPGVATCVFAMLAKWSLTYMQVFGCLKPWCVMKVKAAYAAEVGTLVSAGGHHRPIVDLSKI
jgi:hypothetical protein